MENIPTPPIVAKKDHLVGADVLRGVAILMVVVIHAFGNFYGFHLPWNGWLRDFHSPPSTVFLYLYPISFGWAGVSLFFVLSGFCIHLSFLRSSSFTMARFFWHRFWRIVPAYYVALFFFIAMHHVRITTPEGAEQLVAHLFFVHNFFDDTFFGVNGAFWSIATEVQLYLLFPLLLLIRKSYGIKGCLIVTFVIGIAVRILTLAWELRPGGTGIPDHNINPAFCSPLLTWFDWTLGALVAERFFKKEVVFHHRFYWVMAFLPLFVLSTLYKPLTIISFSLASVIFAVILDGFLRIDLHNKMSVKVLSFIGIISYSIYLWHQPFIYTFEHLNHLFLNPLATTVAGVLFVSLLSVFSYRVFERGGIWIGSKLWTRQQRWPLDSKAAAAPADPGLPLTPTASS